MHTMSYSTVRFGQHWTVKYIKVLTMLSMIVCTNLALGIIAKPRTEVMATKNPRAV